MTHIKGTDKIRGIVDIASLKLQVKKGSTHSLTNEQFYNADIQTALKMKLIEVVGAESDVASANTESQTRIEIRNVSKRPVTIVVDDNSLEPTEVFKFKKKEFKSTTLQPQQSVYVKEFQLKNSELKSAIGSGLLEVVNRASNAADKGEATIKIANCEVTPLENELETNEEIFAPNVIDTDTPKPVKKQDIPDDRKVKSVVWNPTKRPVLGKKIQADPWDPAAEEEEKGPKFVDQEAKKKEIESHPVLKDKPQVNNDEIVMVDQKEEKERIEAHPKLGKK